MMTLSTLRVLAHMPPMDAIASKGPHCSAQSLRSALRDELRRHCIPFRGSIMVLEASLARKWHPAISFSQGMTVMSLSSFPVAFRDSLSQRP